MKFIALLLLLLAFATVACDSIGLKGTPSCTFTEHVECTDFGVHKDSLQLFLKHSSSGEMVIKEIYVSSYALKDETCTTGSINNSLANGEEMLFTLNESEAYLAIDAVVAAVTEVSKHPAAKSDIDKAANDAAKEYEGKPGHDAALAVAAAVKDVPKDSKYNESIDAALSAAEKNKKGCVYSDTGEENNRYDIVIRYLWTDGPAIERRLKGELSAGFP